MKGGISSLKAKAANHCKEQGRDLLEIVLPLLQKRQGPVRNQVSRRTRQGPRVRHAPCHSTAVVA